MSPYFGCLFNAHPNVDDLCHQILDVYLMNYSMQPQATILCSKYEIEHNMFYTCRREMSSFSILSLFLIARNKKHEKKSLLASYRSASSASTLVPHICLFVHLRVDDSHVNFLVAVKAIPLGTSNVSTPVKSVN